MTETIKISVPENISDITLDQYVKFEALRAKEDKLTEQGMIERVISLFTDIKKQQVKKLVHKDYEGLMAQIIAACEQDVEFEQRFTLDGVEYGFIPNLDEITTAEYVDLSTIGMQLEDMHKIMAILFRRITKEDAFGNYDIEQYSHNKENDEIMRRCPMHIVNGALVFFWSLSKELKRAIQRFTIAVEESNRQQTILKNGVGM
jgi:hypothetical protein